MESKGPSGNRSFVDKGNENEAAVCQPNNKVVLGDVIWVCLHGSSWWPAQVFDDNIVSQTKKPRNGVAGEVLVRLYGSYKYMYVDAMTCHTEFENILKQNNGNYTEIFRKALEQDLARFKSGGGKVEEKSKSQKLIARRIKVMQRLGLIAPPGSPFHRNGHIYPNLSVCS